MTNSTLPRALGGADKRLADILLDIAASRSFEALGLTLQKGLCMATGSRSVGVYTLQNQRPLLQWSYGAPAGFLADWEDNLGDQQDPLCDAVSKRGRAISGTMLYGASEWKRSGLYGLLRRWGFHGNMCGPLFAEGKLAGVVYTSSESSSVLYDAPLLEWMDLLCQAGSLALSSQPGLATFSPPAPATQLPPRAQAVARRVCVGESNKEIARALGITDQTVKEHVGRLCKRLGARNRTELATRLMEYSLH